MYVKPNWFTISVSSFTSLLSFFLVVLSSGESWEEGARLCWWQTLENPGCWGRSTTHRADPGSSRKGTGELGLGGIQTHLKQRTWGTKPFMPFY